MYGLLINLIIQTVARVASRYKLFGWWMIVSFLWASAIAVQLPTSYQARQIDDGSVIEIGPEQSCAKAPAEKRDECLLITKPVAKILGTLRLKGAAHYTSIEKLELMLGPPFGPLVLGLIGAFVRHKVERSSAASMLTIAAISLMILSFLVVTAILIVL
jgi:hypothetical protein